MKSEAEIRADEVRWIEHRIGVECNGCSMTETIDERLRSLAAQTAESVCKHGTTKGMCEITDCPDGNEAVLRKLFPEKQPPATQCPECGSVKRSMQFGVAAGVCGNPWHFSAPATVDAESISKLVESLRLEAYELTSSALNDEAPRRVRKTLLRISDELAALLPDEGE